MTDTAKETASVLSRLATLERQNRRLKAGLIAMAGGLGLLFLAGAMPQPSGGTVADVVAAHKFVLVDSKGTTRAALDMVTSAQGTHLPMLFMYEPDGQATVGLGGSDSPALVLRSRNGQNIRVFSDGRRVGLSVYAAGENAIPALTLSVDSVEQGGPALMMRTSAGGDVISLGSSLQSADPDIPSISGHRFWGLQLATRFQGTGSLGTTDATAPRLALFDAEATPQGIVVGSADLVMPQGGRKFGPISSITAFRDGRAVGQWP